MQEWKKELCREQPETLQELGKGTYIQRRNITPYERKDGNGEADKGYSCEYRILTKEEYFAALEQENSNKNMLTSMAAQADIYEKLIETEKNQLVIMQACNMLELYVTLVKAGIRTLDSVPAAFREKVKAAIEAEKQE